MRRPWVVAIERWRILVPTPPPGAWKATPLPHAGFGAYSRRPGSSRARIRVVGVPPNPAWGAVKPLRVDRGDAEDRAERETRKGLPSLVSLVRFSIRCSTFRV